MYFDKLNDIVDKYNNIYHKINKMNPIDVKSRKVLRYHVITDFGCPTQEK